MATSVVHSWQVGHGKVVVRVQDNGTANVAPNNCDAFASVREWNRDANAGFIGDARMTVCNVAVGNGYVDVWVQIDWGSDLEFQISVAIITL